MFVSRRSSLFPAPFWLCGLLRRPLEAPLFTPLSILGCLARAAAAAAAAAAGYLTRATKHQQQHQQQPPICSTSVALLSRRFAPLSAPLSDLHSPLFARPQLSASATLLAVRSPPSAVHSHNTSFPMTFPTVIVSDGNQYLLIFSISYVHGLCHIGTCLSRLRQRPRMKLRQM